MVNLIFFLHHAQIFNIFDFTKCMRSVLNKQKELNMKSLKQMIATINLLLIFFGWKIARKAVDIFHMAKKCE